MTYESFRQYVNREVLKKKGKGRITPRSEARSMPGPSVGEVGAGSVGAGQGSRPASPGEATDQQELPATKGPARISAATSSDKAFDFDPIPRKKR